MIAGCISREVQPVVLPGKLLYNKSKKKNTGGGLMPFEIVRNDIVNMQVDAIVNTHGISFFK